ARWGRGGLVMPRGKREGGRLILAGGKNFRVLGTPPISFAAFDGAMIDDRYAGHTQEIKDSVLAIMRADYAPYNVTLISSDEDGPPNGPFSVVHFGGEAAGLLGLA